MSDPSSHEPSTGRASRKTWLGISAILVGIGAVILADQTKLTATKLLFGGFYIKDQYRAALLYVGVALAILGALLVVLSAIRSTDPLAISALSSVTAVLLAFTLVAGGLIYAAYKHTQSNASSGDVSALGQQPAQPSPPQVSASSSDYPSPCTVYLYGHDAQLTITGPDASSECASFASGAAPSGQTWTTTTEQPSGALSQVCDLISGSDELTVSDDGGQIYGTEACNSFSSQGWSPSSSTSTTPSTASSSTAGGCDCTVADLPNRCDANISTTSGLTCQYAENTFYEYDKTTQGNPSEPATLQAWDPAARRYYTESCSSGDGVVDCGMPGTGGSDVRFNQSAITRYTSSEASSYAASADLGPNG